MKLDPEWKRDPNWPPGRGLGTTTNMLVDIIATIVKGDDRDISIVWSSDREAVLMTDRMANIILENYEGVRCFMSDDPRRLKVTVPRGETLVRFMSIQTVERELARPVTRVFVDHEADRLARTREWVAIQQAKRRYGLAVGRYA